MKKITRKIMRPFFCVFLISSMVASVAMAIVVPNTFGATSALDFDSVAAWNAKVSSTVDGQLFRLLAAHFPQFELFAPEDAFWLYIDRFMNSAYVGEVGYDELQSVCVQMNEMFTWDVGGELFNDFYDAVKTLGAQSVASSLLGYAPEFKVVKMNDTSGLYRIVEMVSGLPVVNSSGQYPCASASFGGGTARGRHWRSASEASAHVVHGKPVNYQSNYSLAEINRMLLEAGYDSQIRTIGNKYNAIWYDYQYYCDTRGYPFVAPLEEDRWASNQERVDTEVKDEKGEPAKDEEGNVIQENNTDNSTNIDVSGMTVMLPTGDMILADSIIYDESTKTYQIDARQYVEEGDTYIYNTYNFTYHVNYTSVTYIGQTAEYDKYYEVYYELPDGRSSADLTRADLEQLNLAVDVIPYGRSADDTSLRSLYHFDGDTKDSSYWNYCTEFVWLGGSSLTYMDAGVFGGALYLDENLHAFDFYLPSDIGSGDFTVQFRYYQSYTAAPQHDSGFYVEFSGAESGLFPFFVFNGSSIVTASGEFLSVMPVGTWNEIAVMRSNGIIYVYLNGLRIASLGFNLSPFGDHFKFYFGDTQQTYKYLDELRVLNYAIVEGGASYTPTSVPHDSNLTLVLPDDERPVADEYWHWDATIPPVLSWDYSTGDVSMMPPSVENEDEDGGYDVGNYRSNQWNRPEGFPQAAIYSNYMTLTSTAASNPDLDATYLGFLHFACPFSPYGLTYGSDCVFSVVLADGTICSLPFQYLDATHSIRQYRDFGSFALVYDRTYTGNLCIVLDAGASIDIAYIEIVSGTQANTGHEFRTSVTGVPKETFHVPSLAVRTDLEITNYQIGGPRPSLPQKGLVWALVENEYITSLQIYNGSAWEAVDGRIWTGERWVPVSSYNIVTMQDMYDIADATPDYEYIYTETGFWSWWQKAWNSFVDRLFGVLGGGGPGGGSEPPSDCEHVYSWKVGREPSCTAPGHRVYTCDSCGHSYTETIEATGHDWLLVEGVPPVLDPEGNVLEEGYDVLECSICGATSKDYGEGPIEDDIFDALGDFLADGIQWLLDKLTELADGLRGITDIFTGFTAKIVELIGGFPLFFGAFVALIPEDLQTVMWFAVVGFVVVAVWRKWAK